MSLAHGGNPRPIQNMLLPTRTAILYEVGLLIKEHTVEANQKARRLLPYFKAANDELIDRTKNAD